MKCIAAVVLLALFALSSAKPFPSLGKETFEATRDEERSPLLTDAEILRAKRAVLLAGYSDAPVAAYSAYTYPAATYAYPYTYPYTYPYAAYSSYPYYTAAYSAPYIFP